MANTIKYLGMDKGNNQPVPLEYQIGDDLLPPKGNGKHTGLGMPITVRFLREIVSNYLSRVGGNVSNFAAGTFGKESILHILSQENCDAIRWTLARIKNDDDGYHNTIALFGVDKFGNPLPIIDTTSSPRPTHPLSNDHDPVPSDPVIYEVSGGINEEDLAKELGIKDLQEPITSEKNITTALNFIFNTK